MGPQIEINCPRLYPIIHTVVKLPPGVFWCPGVARGQFNYCMYNRIQSGAVYFNLGQFISMGGSFNTVCPRGAVVHRGQLSLGAVVTRGQLSPGGSCRPGAVVPGGQLSPGAAVGGGSCRGGSC